MLQQRPGKSIKFLGVLVTYFGQQAGNDGVPAYVIGDIFLGVVRAHLLLVDELLEDVTQHVGIDFPAAGKRPVIKVPVPLTEEREQFFKRGVGHVQRLAVFLLQFVAREQTAVEVGHFAKLGADGRAIGISTLFGKTAEEQRAEKTLIEAGFSFGREVLCQSPP